MAIWQFQLKVAPQPLLACDGLQLTVTEEEYLERLYWPTLATGALGSSLSNILPRRRTWNDSLEGWGFDDGDRVDIYHAQDGSIEWTIFFDLRSPQYALATEIVKLVKEYDGVFVTETRYVLPPSYTRLLLHMRKSAAFRFVENPRQFLEELSRQNGDDGEDLDKAR